MNNIRAIFLVISFFLVFSFQNAFAFNNEYTHPHLTKSAIKKAELDKYLKDNLGLEEGINTVAKKKNKIFFEKKSINDWLQSGAKLEDKPMCRASNHFHDPLVEDWTESGLTDTQWLVNLYCWGFGLGQYPPDEISSNVTWATGHMSPSEKEENGVREFNEWDWDSAREYFYIYLMGKDFFGAEVAPDSNSRDEYLAKSFLALGQVLHLLQDMAVPAHVRNDFSQGHTVVNPDLQNPPKEWIGNPFEKFVKKYDYKHWFDESAGGSLNETSLTNFWDTNNYNGSDPITAENMLGLAEYTNLNFVSSFTIFSEAYPYPMEGSTNIEEYIIGTLHPKDVTDEDGKNRKEYYFSKIQDQDGAKIDHFVIPSYLSEEMFGIDGGIERTYRLDERCFEDYAALLIPRAIGYSAELLDYFFRGELEVISALPFFEENASNGVMVKFKNVTPTQEAMIVGEGGQFALACRYTPEGTNPDGSEDKFVTSVEYSCQEGNCNEIQYGEEVTVIFSLPWEEENRIGMDIYESAEDSVKCMLVFKGKLGNEETAVVGKYFTLGQDQIKFNEEWDNGLTGNHPWEHTQPDDSQNSNNGITANEIVLDTSINTLLKDNFRYAGYDSARLNETNIDFNEVITPYTYLQFKIDDLSKTGSSTQGRQSLLLRFSEGRFLQMTTDGQGYDMNDTTATYSFPLGVHRLINIFEMFQFANISIPDPFYIETISFVQWLFEESQPAATDNNQHMEVDYIRLLEEKQEAE